MVGVGCVCVWVGVGVGVGEWVGLKARREGGGL